MASPTIRKLTSIASPLKMCKISPRKSFSSSTSANVNKIVQSNCFSNFDIRLNKNNNTNKFLYLNVKEPIDSRLEEQNLKLKTLSNDYRNKNKKYDKESDDEDVFENKDEECFLPFTLKKNRQNIFRNQILSIDSPKRKLFLEKKESAQVLGKGSFGIVVKAIYKERNVAVKILNKTRNINLYNKILKNEKNILNLSHININKTFKIIDDSNLNYSLILMEFCNGPDLYWQLHLNDINLNFNQKLSYCFDIYSAIDFLQNHNILHLDIKPKNILINNFNKCVLSDFGSSQIESETDVIPKQEICFNTIQYTDPDIFKGKRLNKMNDIYSLGITFWEIHTRTIPYADFDVHYIIFKVVSENLRPQIFEFIKENEKCFSTLYTSCWHSKYNQRPTIHKVGEELEKIRMLDYESGISPPGTS